MVLGIGFLLIVSLTINAALSAIGERFNVALPVAGLGIQSVRFRDYVCRNCGPFRGNLQVAAESLHRMAGRYFGRHCSRPCCSVSGKYLIGIYLGTAGIASTYGAAGSLVVVLVWVYYSAQIFFLGAEFTRAYAQLYGSHPCDRTTREVQIVGSIDQPGETGGRAQSYHSAIGSL